MESHRVNSIISGRSPSLHCTLTLITMSGHQNKSRLDIIQYFWTTSSRLRYSNFYRELKLKIGFGIVISKEVYGHRCEGPQIYSMPTDGYSYEIVDMLLIIL